MFHYTLFFYRTFKQLSVFVIQKIYFIIFWPARLKCFPINVASYFRQLLSTHWFWHANHVSKFSLMYDLFCCTVIKLWLHTAITLHKCRRNHIRWKEYSKKENFYVDRHEQLNLVCFTWLDHRSSWVGSHLILGSCFIVSVSGSLYKCSLWKFSTGSEQYSVEKASTVFYLGGTFMPLLKL